MGLLLARFFGEPVLGSLWEPAGLVVVVVVDVNIMVLVFGAGFFGSMGRCVGVV